MSNQQLATFNPGMLPAAVQHAMSQMTVSELSQNVGANYAVISIRGKVFRIKFGGAETNVMMTMPDGSQIPAPYLDVVIPRANGALSKTYYKNAYAEGDDGQPDCWSEDGVNPLAPEAQRPLVNGAPCVDCRLCPANVWGSKILPSGKQGRACADTRKVAIVPLANPSNDAFGGPMLLRVPGASLGPLAEFDRAMQSKGIPYFAVAVRISFDQTTAFPKLVFQPIRAINDAEAAVILPLRDDPRTLTVINAAQALPQSPSAPQPDQQFTPPAAVQQYQQQAPAQNAAAQPSQFQQPAPAQPAPQQFTAPEPAPQQFQQQAPQQAAPTQAFTPPAEGGVSFGAPTQAAPAQAAPTQQAPAQAFQQPQVAPQQPAPQQAFVAPTQAAPTQAFTAPQQAAPETSPQGGAAPPPSDDLLSRVNNLLGS